ncbi:hypothetical protein BDN70DRAFT_861148 [Pholiota conissans]|uniref:Uncharacterized protein n=1 Tax=Pholiota conissans TaxID=109636 RepID=A0A9P6CYZ6_9AGAR|nr:hypothetical protein BDN70DRAFT_861148 [Pholiota conissans]
MSFSSRINRDFLDFIETAQYNPPSASYPTGSGSQAGLPHSWRQYQHPIGDVYFHNHSLRLTTGDNVRNSNTLQYIMDAYEDHSQSIAGDPNYQRLPSDIETVVSDVTPREAVIRMYSRRAGTVFHYSEEQGLRFGMTEEFWSHIAEFPSHHRDLPPTAESQFVQSITAAKSAISEGTLFCFTEQQIDKIIARYQELIGFREQGRNVIPSLSWLIGAVMPLEPLRREVGGHNLDHILYGTHR